MTRSQVKGQPLNFGPVKRLALWLRPHEHELVKRAALLADKSVQGWMRDVVIAVAKVDEEDDLDIALETRRKTIGERHGI